MRETLSRVTPDGRIEVIARIPGGPNGAAAGPDGKIYVCNNGGMDWIREGAWLRPGLQRDGYVRGSIDVVAPATGRVDRLYDRCEGIDLRGPNDIVFDGAGGFWFTDLGKRRDRDMDLGFVYWAKADGSHIRQVAEGLITPNGIGLSPDGTTLYVAETATGRLWAWEILAPGELRKLAWPSPYGARLVAGPGGRMRFDGLAVSASGAITLATLDRGAVVEVSPSGQVLGERSVPDLLVTNICFGGADMRTAYVTLSHEGRLVALDWHEPGLRLRHQGGAPV